MEALREEQISGKVLDHLGLVASTIKKLGLVEKIDQRIPISKSKGAKVTIGQRVAAMILNGLGFIDDRLYLFPQFLKNKPIDRLFGADLCAQDFNDDALGRGLDVGCQKMDVFECNSCPRNGPAFYRNNSPFC